MAEHQSTAGMVIGGVLGGIKGYYSKIGLLTVIPYKEIGDTMLLAAIGAITGFIVTELLKYVKEKLKNKNKAK